VSRESWFHASLGLPEPDAGTTGTVDEQTRAIQRLPRGSFIAPQGVRVSINPKCSKGLSPVERPEAEPWDP
jgi:hypothetical protein